MQPLDWHHPHQSHFSEHMQGGNGLLGGPLQGSFPPASGHHRHLVILLQRADIAGRLPASAPKRIKLIPISRQVFRGGVRTVLTLQVHDTKFIDDVCEGEHS